MKFVQRVTIGLVVAACLVYFCAADTSVAQAEPTYVITISQTIDPVEATVGDEVQLRFNVNVSDAEGNPAQLDAAIDIAADLQAFSDSDSGLSTAAASDSFHFPAGYTGGTRTLITAVSGNVPPKPIILQPPVTFSTVALDVELDVIETATIQVRSKAFESDGVFDFCISPGRGERGSDPLLFSDFKRVLVVAHVTGAGLPSATILAGVQIDVVELVEGEEAAQAEIEVLPAQNTRVVDADNDGFSEGVNAVIHLEASLPVAVATNVTRVFRLRVRHTDGINTAVLGQQDFDVETREQTSVPAIPIVGDNLSFSARFERRQSRAFSPTPRILRNGVELNAAARATLTLEPYGGNAQPSEDSGLFDLGWRVVVDWKRLQALEPWLIEDTLTLRIGLPGPGNFLDLEHEIAVESVNASVFRTPESLTAKEYDNDVTEQTHVDALVAALKAAGVVARRTPEGDEVELPSVLAKSAEEFPNWSDTNVVLRAIKNAIMAYKTAPRVLEGVDCLAGQMEWNVCVPIQCPLVNVDGTPVLDDDGNPVMKTINLKIFFNPQRTGRNGKDTKGDDGGKPCTLLIVIGQCGVSEGGNPGNGGKADADVTGRGSVGIAVGGDGSSNRDDPASGEKGGNGGAGGVTVGKKPSKAADGPGPTGVAIGGDGGDTVGPQAKPGDGGDAKAKGDKDACGSVVSRGGDSGHGQIPPPKGGHSSGTAEAENGDSVDGETPDGEKKTIKKKTNKIKGGGRRGRVTGGIVRAEKDDTPDSADGTPQSDPNPITGG